MIFLDRDKCIHCGACKQYCPEHAIITVDGRAKIVEEKCTECGKCIKSCYMLAIKRINNSK